jgi:hypothetical protein
MGKTFGKLSKFKTITAFVDNFQDYCMKDLLNTMKDDRIAVKLTAVILYFNILLHCIVQ